MKLLLLLMGIWNLITFSLMGIDKRKAKKEERRIRERTLLLCSFLMGGLGISIGMEFFHHKTKKMKFLILVPLSLVVNGVVVYVLIHMGIV